MWYPLAGDACWQPARPPFVKQLHVTLPVRCCWKQKTWTVGMETVDNPHARTDTSRREIHEIQFSLEVIIQDARLQTSPHNGSPFSLSLPLVTRMAGNHSLGVDTTTTTTRRHQGRSTLCAHPTYELGERKLRRPAQLPCSGHWQGTKAATLWQAEKNGDEIKLFTNPIADRITRMRWLKFSSSLLTGFWESIPLPNFRPRQRAEGISWII